MSDGSATLELDTEFDKAVNKSAERHIRKVLKTMRKNDRGAYDLLASLSGEAHEDLTDGEEREVTEALGRYGLSNVTPRQKILDAFAKSQYSGNLLNQNELAPPKPGYVEMTAEVAALEASEPEDPTPDPKPPAFSAGPG